MTKYNYAIVVGLVKDVHYQTNVQQLQQFESKNLRIRKALSEDDQSQTIASFMRDTVIGNISYVLEVVRKLSQHDNCDVEFEFGDRKPTKIMIRKAGSTRAVVSLVITFRTLMSDNSESTLCMISHDDTLQSHLACSSPGFLYFVPSKEALPLFSSSFRSGEREQKFVSKVMLIALDENDSISKLIVNPNFDEIKEFTKNDREVVSRNTDNSSSSSKSAKRKSTNGSDRADKTAKNAETATAPKTIADTGESPIVDETTKKSTKKSKTKDPNEPKKPLTDFFRWSKANRDRIQEENPNLAFGDLSKKMGKQWKKVPDEEKAALKAAYQEEKKIYDEQLEKYNNNNNKNVESDKSKDTPKTTDQTANASASTSSKKKGKRKAASNESEKANKAAKSSMEEAVEALKTPEKEKTPEKTSTDTDESPIVETTKKSTKKSKTKDPNEPKKPLTDFFRWSKANRDRIQEENPNLAFGDLSKKMGKQWKKVPDEEKAALKAAYQEEKKIYDEQLEKYNNNNSKNVESDKSKDTPKTADQTANASASTSSKKKGKRKAASNESEKANKAAKSSTEEAVEALKTPEKEKTPEKTSTDTDESPIVETTKKSTKKSKTKDPNAPKKPAHYNVQYQKSIRSEVVEENPDLSSRNINKLTAKRYKEASDEELQPFKSEYDANVKIYKEELEKYNNNNSKNVESDKSKDTPKTADQTANASASTSSKKKGKRKAASNESEKANKAAKSSTEEAVEALKTPEKEKTPEKTSTDTDESPIVETTKKSTKKSKTKDPNAPKKPAHYNVQYQKSIRSEVVEENPDLSSRNINKLTAKRYKEASDEELQPFKSEYDANVKIYKEELEKYQKKKNNENEVEENSKEKNVELEENNAKKNKGNDDEKDVEENNKEETVTKTTKKGKKKKKKKSAIKKNVSAYMHFSRSKNPELKEKGIKPPQSGTILGNLWRELPDSERAEFDEIAKKDKERYLKEVEEAKATEELKSYLKKNWNSVPDPEV